MVLTRRGGHAFPYAKGMPAPPAVRFCKQISAVGAMNILSNKRHKNHVIMTWIRAILVKFMPFEKKY